ncbi:MAG: protein kinase [Euryarchaeota archaeon]|nr:protein kinase [Euryarchaeota archaeon]
MTKTLVWNPTAIPGFAAGLALIVLSVLVYLGASHRFQNRLAALVLFLEAAVNFLMFGVSLSVTEPGLAHAAVTTSFAAWFALVFAYLALVSTLGSPLVRPLRSDVGRVLLVTGAMTAVSLLVVFTEWFLGPLVRPAYAPYSVVPASAYYLAAQATTLVFLFGLAVAVDAWRRAPEGSVARRRAGGFAVAFGIRDVGLALVFLSVVFRFPPRVALHDGPLIPPLIIIVFASVLAYALLKHQVFDLDLKVKWVMRRATVFAVVGVAFVMADDVIESLLPVEGMVASLLAAGAAALLVYPAWRLAGPFSERVLPGVTDTRAYRDLRRFEVYRAALQEAARDGVVDASQERLLARLRQDLGISPREHVWLLAAVASDRRGSIDWSPGSRVLERYRVQGLLGSGAFARTFLAADATAGERVVIKVFHAGAGAARQVEKEARALAAVDHPNVVRYREVTRDGEEAFLVMEYVDGGTLKERFATGPLPRQEVAALARDLLSGLDALHSVGIVHRDLKPVNILVTRTGTFKIADLGVALAPDVQETAGTRAPGTLVYMSPEQARGQKVTATSDLYSAALILYEAATGGPLNALEEGETAWDLQTRVARGPTLPHDTALPDSWRSWFDRALDPRPSRRFHDAEVMAREWEKATYAGLPATQSSAKHSSDRPTPIT